MIGRRISFGAKAIMLPFFFVVSLAGCAAYASQDTRAPTPGESYKINRDELPKIENRATHGDVKAINSLIDYYLLYEGDEKQGWIWMERLGDAGDVAARRNVLMYYEQRPSPTNTVHLKLLKARWGM